MVEIIKNQVSSFRLKKGVTQEEFAVAVGVTRQTVIAIEKGNYTPSVLLALKIAKFFKQPVEKFLALRMENKKIVSEFSLSLLLLVLVSLCLDPVQARWMPTMLANGILAAVIAAFVGFAVFIWKEKAPDERAEQHRLVADRIAFLIGAGILVLGVLWQTWHHGQNIWLLGALVGMVLSKLGVLVYQEMRR